MNEAADLLIARIRARLHDSDPDWWRSLREKAEKLRLAAIADARNGDADRAWFLETVCSARGQMAHAFAEMAAGNFRQAWPTLERVEQATAALKRNAFLPLENFEIELLSTMVTRWQALYPYTVFASPEIAVRRHQCAICDDEWNPIDPCGHEPGVVYDGRMCVRVAKDCEFLSISIVSDPEQKYSVLIPEKDPHNYLKVRYVTDLTRAPFARWIIRREIAYHDHALFDGWRNKGPCPCRSGRFYNECCLPLPGVKMPHDVVMLDSPLPEGVSKLVVHTPPPPD